MTKLFLILSALAIGGSAVVGVMNRSNFVKVREDKDAENAKVAALIKEYDDSVEEPIKQTITDKDTTGRDLKRTEAELETAKSDLTRISGELADEQAKEAPLDEELTKVEMTMAAIRDALEKAGFARDAPVSQVKQNVAKLEEKANSLAKSEHKV